MNRGLRILGTVILAISLSGCGWLGGDKEQAGDVNDAVNHQTSENEQNEENGPENEGRNASDDRNEEKETTAAVSDVPTVEEIFQRASEATGVLSSYSSTSILRMNMTGTFDGQSEEQAYEVRTTMDLIREPLQLFQSMRISMDGGTQDLKQYVTEEGVYSHVDGLWIKHSEDTSSELISAMKEALVDKQLEQYRLFAKDMKVSVQDKAYELHADFSGEILDNFRSALIQQMANGNRDISDMLNKMEIQNVKLSYVVDKNTYLPTKLSIVLSVGMDVDGQGFSMRLMLDSTFSKFGEIKPIHIPQEAIDTAYLE
ncbi:hypothetical protein M3201_22870 [Paenibacillus motobuensis]|uniref:DUF6612 family protein n=1 Tax=Paenibacillus TaxID=44249 RepID=UPI00203E5780|nr:MULTISPECIES: DUF6612 family protein [Paenibacillus]MCM3042502.1 hypothetical protein [Paenibacillus lutimineralis]MCM3649606.1 hypothetical protein [Paenibacillus motobuensis]